MIFFYITWVFLSDPWGPVKEDWMHTIQKIDDRLAGWKRRSLSKGVFALTLIASVDDSCAGGIWE